MKFSNRLSEGLKGYHYHINRHAHNIIIKIPVKQRT